MGRQENSEQGTQCLLLPSSSSSSAPLPSSPSSTPLALEQSTECERAEAHNQSDNTVYKWWRTMEDNHKEFWEQGHGPSPSSGGSYMPDPSIHIGLLRLTSARETEGGGGGEREREKEKAAV